MFESTIKAGSGRETTGHFTRKSSFSAAVPRHLLLLAGHAQKGRVLWLVLGFHNNDLPS